MNANTSSGDSSNATSNDTTFTSNRAGSIETRVVSRAHVSSIGKIQKVTVTVPKSKVDSVNNVSQQSMNRQLQDMNNANKRVLDSLKNLQ